MFWKDETYLDSPATLANRKTAYFCLCFLLLFAICRMVAIMGASISNVPIPVPIPVPMHNPVSIPNPVPMPPPL